MRKVKAMSSNLPLGFSSGVTSVDEHAPQRCKNGHEWNVPMYYCDGGWQYYNDDDAICPECGEEALDEEATSSGG